MEATKKPRIASRRQALFPAAVQDYIEGLSAANATPIPAELPCATSLAQY
jgi:hypothetical protein